MTASNYINREASWLEFNQRVLDEACDPSVPLLERLRFLAITASNLDEFFMVRVGGLRILTAEGHTRPDPTGLSPRKQLIMIRQRIRQMVADQYACLDQVLGHLEIHGLRRQSPDDLSEARKRELREEMHQLWASLLSPTAIRPEEPFPLLVNQMLHVAVRLKPAPGSDQTRFAIMPLGAAANRILNLRDDSGYSFILLEDALRCFPEVFFDAADVLEITAFRITRNADLTLRDDLAADLVSDMEQILTARRHSECVRLELENRASPELLAFLLQHLPASADEVYLAHGPIDLAALMRLADTPGFDVLRYRPWPAQASPVIDPSRSMFEILTERDVLLHHPYQGFEPVVRLIEEAADDPHVLAIKQTLYRTSRKSPIVAALRRAAENGKYVTAIVELKARFDEARNIEWARSMEESSVQVIYGVKGLKTHAKICMIVRREPHGVQRYVHFGTGNYNEQTARIYSDISLLTADGELGADAARFFNAITGFSMPQRFLKIEAAPIGLRERILEMIAAETQRRQQGQKAHIVAKINSLSDPDVIDALYAASQAGVTVRLNVRGICCLKPGVPKLSENISVISIVDRFLEHSRIFYFYQGGDERVFISSADWMPRNLNRRVELLTPVEDAHCKRALVSILDVYFRDTVKARRLMSDGSYVPIRPAGRRKKLRAQEELYRQAVEQSKDLTQSQKTMFQPHRPSDDEQ